MSKISSSPFCFLLKLQWGWVHWYLDKIWSANSWKIFKFNFSTASKMPFSCTWAQQEYHRYKDFLSKNAPCSICGSNKSNFGPSCHSQMRCMIASFDFFDILIKICRCLNQWAARNDRESYDFWLFDPKIEEYPCWYARYEDLTFNE